MTTNDPKDTKQTLSDVERGSSSPSNLSSEGVRRERSGATPLRYHEYQRLLGDGPSFWDAMMAWRATNHSPDAQHLRVDMTGADFPRDKTTGRPSPFSDS